MTEGKEETQTWWAKLFLQLGFPTALAILLVATLLGWMRSPMMDRLERIEYQMWQQTMIMRTICYSLGAESARRSCEPWKPQSESQ